MPKDNKRSRSRSREKSPSRKNRNKKRQQSEGQARMDSEEQQKEPRWKVQETKTIKIENCTDVAAVERALIDVSIKAATSVPDEIELKDNSVFAKYPSIQVSSTIIGFLSQKITIEKKEYNVNFYPYRKYDLNIAYDWYCDRCDYKNFARREKCYRCENEKNQYCKLNYNTAAKASKNNEDNINLLSLMVRGPIIMETEEEDILDLFEQYASVKDIRMIKNRMTDQKKDFAFIEFYSQQDAAVAFKNTTSPDFRVRGEKVSVMYSRNKSDDDYAKLMPFEKRDRRRDRRERRQEGPVENYYNRQRKLEIQHEKQRPLITLEQLKEKHEQQMKKNASAPRQMTEQQTKRRQAEMMAKQWEKESRLQNSVMYICVVCRRKFKNEEQMKAHETSSDLHKFNFEKYQLSV